MINGIELLHVFQDIRESLPVEVSKVTAFCSDIILFYLLFMVMAFFLWKDGRKGCLPIIVVYVISFGIYAVVASIFAVPRPWVLDPTIVPFHESHGYSFPSGHTTSVAAVLGMVAYLVRKRSVTIVCVALILFVMIQRMYDCAHTPLDVTAGCIAGLVSIAITAKLMKYISDDPYKTKILYIAMFAYIVFYVAFACFNWDPIELSSNYKDTIAFHFRMAVTPMIYMIGMFVVDNYKIDIRIPHDTRNQIIGYAVGLVIVFCILRAFTYVPGFGDLKVNYWSGPLLSSIFVWIYPFILFKILNYFESKGNSPN